MHQCSNQLESRSVLSSAHNARQHPSSAHASSFLLEKRVVSWESGVTRTDLARVDHEAFECAPVDTRAMVSCHVNVSITEECMREFHRRHSRARA